VLIRFVIFLILQVFLFTPVAVRVRD